MPVEVSAADSRTTLKMLERAAAGEAAAAEELLARHRGRLERVVALRLDPRLKDRPGAAAMVDGVMDEARKRLVDYLALRPAPFFLWLHSLALEIIAGLHRQNLDASVLETGAQIYLYRNSLPSVSTLHLASRLLGRAAQLDPAAARAELQVRLQEALNRMEPLDREVLLLRHFERLTSAEAAWVLKTGERETTRRYLSALNLLNDILVGWSWPKRGIH